MPEVLHLWKQSPSSLSDEFFSTRRLIQKMKKLQAKTDLPSNPELLSPLLHSRIHHFFTIFKFVPLQALHVGSPWQPEEEKTQRLVS